MSDTEDFLESDPQIRGQNYCCISFVSPEDVLANKQVFIIDKFLKVMAKKYDLQEPELQDQYKDFLYVNQEKLESEFYEKNEFKTSVRGVKIRGSYDTLQEAQSKAKKLQQNDKGFNVYIGQVGFWLPWDPNPHNIESQEYAEGELNTLVKKYKENQDKKDLHFQENIEYARDQADIAKKKSEAENTDGDIQSVVNVESEDSSIVEVNEETLFVSPDEPVAANDDGNLKDLQDSMSEQDPWLKQKLANN